MSKEVNLSPLPGAEKLENTFYFIILKTTFPFCEFILKRFVYKPESKLGVVIIRVCATTKRMDNQIEPFSKYDCIRIHIS